MVEKFGFKSLIAIVVAMLIGIVSFFGISKAASSPNLYKTEINYLDEKKTNVELLTAGSAASSLIVSALPDDIGTPIADKLADLSSYFIVVLSAVFLEKYLLTIIGFTSWRIIIPIACAIFIFAIITGKYNARLMSYRILAFGIAVFIAIPASVRVSQMIEEIYDNPIQSSIENIQEITGDTKEKAKEANKKEQEKKKEDLSLWEKITTTVKDEATDIVDDIKDGTTGVVEKAKSLVSNLIEAIAIMIVTSCLIPLLTLAFFLWLLKVLFKLDIASSGVKGIVEKVPKVNSFMKNKNRD